MDMYKQAGRLKIRFGSDRGWLTVEDLWNIPLRSKSDFNLNEIAKAVNRELKESAEESFVEEKTAGNEILELKMAIIKDIIADKLQEEKDAKDAVARKAKKEQLMEILQRKQNAELENLSAGDIEKMINEL